MENDKQESMKGLVFVVKIIIIGLLSGFIGMVAFAALTPPTDLYADIRNALLAGFFTMTAALTVVTYRHNKRREKRTNQSK
jgi:TctA family transporter